MIKKIGKNDPLLYLVLFSLLILGIVIFTNFLSISKTGETIYNQLKKEQLTETEFAATQMEIHILQVKDELTTISKFPIKKTENGNTCDGDISKINEKVEGKLRFLLRVDKEGEIVECSSPEVSDYLGLNIKNKDYFKIPKETNEPFIAGSVKQGEQIIITVPLFKTTKYTPYPNFMGAFEGLLMSIIEPNQLYYSYIHPFVEKDINKFLLINLKTKKTLLKSEDLKEYEELSSQLPELKDGSTEIINLMDFGDTIITSSDISLGSETWRLIILTPMNNLRPDIKSVQRKHIFSLIFVIFIIISVFSFLIHLSKTKEEVQSKLDKTNITLKNLGINIQFEENTFNQADIRLDSGKIYLIKQDEENHAYELFINALNKGFAGFGIIREDPRKIKKKYNLQKTPFIWLTNNKIENIPCETNIKNLYNLVSEFVKKGQKSVILFDRLDYILMENNFEEVIKKIHALRDLASTHECIIILSVNPTILEEKHLKAIEEETIDLYGKHLRKRVELSDMEMDILNYINTKNQSNKLASYGEITNHFKITKPTTRVKINKLQNLELISIEQKGRFKSLKITSAGRRII